MTSSDNIFSLLDIAFSVTSPIFIIISLGAWLNHIKFINEEFIRIASKIIFNIGLPIMLFTNTASHDFNKLINLTHLAIILATTIIVFIVSQLTASQFIENKRDKGVFVQGAFRGNLIILGLAFCSSAYGEKGIAIATLPMAIIIIVYNLLSIYTLNASLLTQSFSLKKSIDDIIKNPLIIGIVAGLLVNSTKLPIPNVIMKSSHYLSQMTLPLALLAIGGSLNFLQMKENLKPAIAASVFKIVLSPIIMITLLLLFPIEKTAAGVLFFLAASPTATASFIMVKAMNGNSDLAAKIIILSTFVSIITVTFGFAMLVALNLIALN
ncbi:AEC family transporter [Thalassotalea castellviae]|uniref:AEC family transporter n=1 Tax=Thalassotalea castellviae TaxID=3075612 RepID=A0ABU2ZY77_9GAMM|nr:AEC family transporter [Thalassotalea sp. W431]MDT0602510.1 AEC family transporter [Thalassotalea sp. W431]